MIIIITIIISNKLKHLQSTKTEISAFIILDYEITKYHVDHSLYRNETEHAI